MIARSAIDESGHAARGTYRFPGDRHEISNMDETTDSAPDPEPRGGAERAFAPAPAKTCVGGRREPLPWHRPKEAEDDPLARDRVLAILQDPSYRLADEDVDFLARNDLRGLRLQLDYYKAELQLEQHGVEHTIVVFGSTRIAEPAAARRALRLLKAQSGEPPGTGPDKGAQHGRRIAIAERIQAKSHYYDVARELGQRIAQAGEGPADTRIMVMTGGGPGIMEAANRGAFDAGAKSIGLNIALPHEQYPNPYITPELCLRFHYFALRKLHFMMRARALVAFPGGYGTFDELFETLTLIQTRKINPVPVVLVGEAYWRRAFDVDFLVDEGVIAAEDRDLFWYAESAAEIWDGIVQWHRDNGTPLYPPEASGAAPVPE
jgi:uncharacterized protein (TIGR00730 family)